MQSEVQSEAQVDAPPTAEIAIGGLTVIEQLYHGLELAKLWAAEEGMTEVDWPGFAKDMTVRVMGGRSHLFIAMMDGKAVGYTDVSTIYDPAISANVCFGERMFVMPEYRERGVASALAEALEEWTIEGGCKRGFVDVAKDKPWLVAFYEGWGFEVTHFRMMWRHEEQ